MDMPPQVPTGTTQRRPVHRLLTAVVGLLAVAGLVVAAVVMFPRTNGADANSDLSAPVVVIRPGDQPVSFASAPTAGVLRIAVPRGTAEVRLGGELGYVLPPVMNLHTGDKVIITNNDISPHLVMWAFLMPGQTVERVFDKPGSETYSAGCTVDPTPAGFTTLFVSGSD